MNFYEFLIRNGINYDKCALSDSKHVRGVGLPINYVLRNAHFCINSGAQFSLLIL